MVKHWDREGAEVTAMRLSQDGRMRVVCQREGKINAGPSWLVLTYAEYGRMRVTPCVSHFVNGRPYLAFWSRFGTFSRS
jgi:hypothetical protein